MLEFINRQAYYHRMSEAISFEDPNSYMPETDSEPPYILSDDTMLEALSACEGELIEAELDGLLELFRGNEGPKVDLARSRIMALLNERAKFMPSNRESSKENPLSPIQWQILSQLVGHMPNKQVQPVSLDAVCKNLNQKLAALNTTLERELISACANLMPKPNQAHKTGQRPK